MKERYNIIPCVLVPYECDLADRCRENGIEVLCEKFYLRCGGKIRTGFKAITKHILNKTSHYRKIFNILNGRHFDIIHTNTIVTDAGIAIAKKFHVPHVWHIREYGIEDHELYYCLPDFLVRRYYAQSERVITVSESLRKKYVDERRLCSHENTSVILNGIRIPEGYTKHRHPEHINFCIAGGISNGKNHMMAINACKILMKSTDKFNLHIIGGDSGELAQSLKKLIASYGLSEHVKFWGWRNDATDIMRDMDVGLMVSRCEAFGRVTVEYMMNYMPVIGTNTGGTPEIIADGETGFLCPLDDADRLAELMMRFINEPELLASMGNAGRIRAVEKFSLERNTDEIYSLYTEILC